MLPIYSKTSLMQAVQFLKIPVMFICPNSEMHRKYYKRINSTPTNRNGSTKLPS